MKRYLVLIGLMIVLPQFLMAQTYSDAYRMTHTQIQGTARSAGMGNAFGALGGDFTSLSINPAGSAIYQSGEFVFTPGYYVNTTEHTVGGEKFSDNDQSFSLNNIGLIGTYKTNGSESGIVSVNYGIGYNRLANFNSNSFANFGQSGVSWLDDITDYANTEGLSNTYLSQDISDVYYSDWAAKLAWDTYLIDPASDTEGETIDGQYQSILYEDELVDQYKTFAQEGYLDEYIFNLSFNFNHQFYLGATVGIRDLDYESHTMYKEVLSDGDSYIYDDDYDLDGHGINFKLGAIFKPTRNTRLGLAVHSPTFYEINDRSDLYMASYLAQNYSNYGISEYDYDFNTPWKVIASGAFIFSKRGLISFDAEYEDYASMRFRRGGNGSYNFSEENSYMDDYFNSVINLRVGAEYKVSKQIALRAGYEHYGNPFESTLDQQTTLTDDVQVFSAGLGYTVNNFSLNVAYTNSSSSTSQGNAQPNFYQVPTDNSNHNVLMSFGFRF